MRKSAPARWKPLACDLKYIVSLNICEIPGK